MQLGQSTKNLWAIQMALPSSLHLEQELGQKYLIIAN